MEMPQLVRIAHDIDCGNLVILDLERGGLEDVVLFDGDESGQTTDKAIIQKPRSRFCKYEREHRVELHDLVETGNRVRRSSNFSATVGISDDILREECSQPFHVAAARRCEERGGDLEATFLR